jgi:hypothetical protein
MRGVSRKRTKPPEGGLSQFKSDDRRNGRFWIISWEATDRSHGSSGLAFSCSFHALLVGMRSSAVSPIVFGISKEPKSG